MAYEGMTAQHAPAARAVDNTEVLGRRVGAMIIDSVMLWIAFTTVGSAVQGGHSGHGRAAAISFLIYFCVTLAYFLICEGAAGQTLGKKLVGIKVVSLDGGRASWGQVAGRTMLRVVDALPILYIVGFVVALFNGRRQRIGDIAARTQVIPA